MGIHTRLLCGAAAIVLAGASAPAFAQDAGAQPASASGVVKTAQNTQAPPPADQTSGTAATAGGSQPGAATTVGAVVITGLRASLQSAQAIKERSTNIVDSIQAQDIGKLPDVNTAEALSRVTGVQINTDLGEGATVVVRGLSQVETLMNGREVFTAAGTRTLNFEFIPSELLAGVDVYKTQSADLTEGGLGGTINVRTHRPFDFKGLTISGSLLGNYGDLYGKTRPTVSGLISDRWDTGIGEVGALISATYQERGLREDYISAGAPTCYGTVVSGHCTANAKYPTPFIGPNGYYNPQYTAERERTGLTGALQWRPSQNLEFYVDADYERFVTQQSDVGTYPLPFVGLNTIGPVTLYPGTNILESATFANAGLRTLGIARDTMDTNALIAAGGKWTSGPLTLKGDVSYLYTTEDLYYRELDMQTTLPTLSINTSTAPVSATYTGVNLASLPNYHFAGLTDSINHWRGHEAAVQFDGTYDVNAGPLANIAFGARYAQIADGLTPIRYFNGSINGPAVNEPGLVEPYPYNTPYTGTNVPTIGGYLNVNPIWARNIGDLFNIFGVPTPTVQTQGIYKISEDDIAGYVMANFDFNLGVPIDGNIGVRIVNTDDHLTGTETINGTPTQYIPISRTNSYTNVLPSVNVRAHLTDQLLLRFAASQSVTRPEFSQLNPGLTLVPANLTGAQGNPGLAPYKADNYDVALEWYFARTGSVYGTLFYKNVNGFPFTRGTEQVINGQTYIISQPVNSGSGKVQGAEVGYQQFYTFLPGLFSGLGFQGNVTFVDSSAPTSVANFTAPLPNLSKWSYNLIGMYEKGPFSARVAWNWRSKFVQGIGVASGVGVVPTVSKPYGMLDAALNYDITPHVTLTLEGSNLLRAQHRTYVGSTFSPAAFYEDDRQVLAGIRFKW